MQTDISALEKLASDEVSEVVCAVSCSGFRTY